MNRGVPQLLYATVSLRVSSSLCAASSLHLFFPSLPLPVCLCVAVCAAEWLRCLRSAVTHTDPHTQLYTAALLSLFWNETAKGKAVRCDLPSQKERRERCLRHTAQRRPSIMLVLSRACLCVCVRVIIPSPYFLPLLTFFFLACLFLPHSIIMVPPLIYQRSTLLFSLKLLHHAAATPNSARELSPLLFFFVLPIRDCFSFFCFQDL